MQVLKGSDRNPNTVVYGEVRQRQHPPECVLGWVRCAGVVVDSQWGCWRAEEDGWNPSGERMTEELRRRKMVFIQQHPILNKNNTILL